MIPPVIEVFYVSVRDGKKYGLLVGPCKTHEEALALVEDAKRAALGSYPFAHFYAYGTTKVTLVAPYGDPFPGILNETVGYTPKRLP